MADQPATGRRAIPLRLLDTGAPPAEPHGRARGNKARHQTIAAERPPAAIAPQTGRDRGVTRTMGGYRSGHLGRHRNKPVLKSYCAGFSAVLTPGKHSVRPRRK